MLRVACDVRRYLLIALAVLAVALPLAWLAGEAHRENCIRSGRVACSVLPWENGHVYVNPQPSDDELAPYYDSSYHVFTSVPQDVDEEVAALERGGEDRYRHVRIVPGSDFLDVGCGIGDQVAVMAALGVSARGVELNPIAVGVCRKRGLDVFCGTLAAAAYADGTFDDLSLSHVLEHIPEPLPLLKECYRVLKPGGELVIAVPNVRSLIFEKTGRDWVNLDLPRHLHHFSPSSLGKAVEAVGFRVNSLATEAYEPLVEASMIEWVHRRSFLPRRLIRKTGMVATMSRRLTREAEALDRGEVIVIRAGKE